MNLEELYCSVDDFMKLFLPVYKKRLLADGQKRRNRSGQMSLSEMISIVILFHQAGYRCFKHFYQGYVRLHLQSAFPSLISYSRFIQLMPSMAVPLCAYLQSCYGKPTGISYIDSAKLSVCHNLRIPRHKVFADIAERGKTSCGWFYGFKLHLIANEQGQLLAVKLTPGNIDDREPVPDLVTELFGKLFGDKGYISQSLAEQLALQNIELITNVRRNMKPKALTLLDKILLRKRFIIETMIDQLKNISQIEHSRHRSLWNFMVNLAAGLVAYCHQPKKPMLNLADYGIFRMPVAVYA